jgi:hypothetical protein
MNVGFPTYSWSDFEVVIPDGATFGFWPASSNAWVETDEYTAVDNADGTTSNDRTIKHTWFFGADGVFAGWINAARLSDSVLRDGMLFHDELDRIITLSADLEVKKVERFVWSDGSAAPPQKLFPELRLGFFHSGKKLVLARW